MARKKGKTGLNPLQKKFVVEYLVDFNATKAAIRAGYSPKSAYSQAHELLKVPEIRAAIALKTDALLTEAGVSAGRIIREYSRIAFGDIREGVNWDDEGNVTWTPSADLPADFAATIGEFSQTVTVIPQKGGGEPIERRQMKLKQHDKLNALAKLFEYEGLARDMRMKVELTGKDGGPVEHVVDHRATLAQVLAKVAPLPDGGAASEADPGAAT